MNRIARGCASRSVGCASCSALLPASTRLATALRSGSTADIVREYGPFSDVAQVGGVSYDGTNIWIAAGETMKAIDPERGTTVRSLNVPAHAGTAFDGKYLFQ